jgi:nucleoside-diphosphate-sugar epimerase
MNHYRDTKALLTQRACRYADDHKLNLTVLEPAWVYGEREFNTGFHSYLKAVQNGMKYAPGSRDNLFHVIYARDLAQAYLLAYRRRLPGVHRIIAGNPAPAKLHDIHSMFCAAAKLSPPKLLPKWLVYPLGLALELAATLGGRSEPPLLTRSRVNMMYDNIVFSSALARQLLGFEARTPLPEGISNTVTWYKQNGYIAS